MNMKNKIIWKLIAIVLCIIGILLLYFLKSGNGKETADQEYSQRELLLENEKASIMVDKPTEAPAAEEARAETPDEDTSSMTASSDESIRVLIKTDGFSGYYHESVDLTVNGDYMLTGSETISVPSGDTLSLKSDNPYFIDGKLQLTPVDNSNTLTLLSITRTDGHPAYRGSLTIYSDDNGLRIVNELPLEEYLCSVVPSEMPSSYEMEALKAQAVCARTYASVQMRDNKLADMGAHVDDSVTYQVYNNVAATDRTTKAVQETKNEVLCKDGVPIDAYYFSTSHGKTSTDEVWEAFAPAPYLKSVECRYDEQEPWYRWEVTFPTEQLLNQIQKKYPQIEDLKSITIAEVGEGDAVLKITVESSSQSITIGNEYDIRELFAPQGLMVKRQDGSEVKGSSLLPSAYFTLTPLTESDHLTGYLFNGGGYGHGVGLSQNAAQNMAQDGNDYQAILYYFYNEVELKQIKDIPAS